MNDKLQFNYHTHCRYCHHAKGEVIDYVNKAIELGYKELGMSDHAPVIRNLAKLYGEKYACFGSNMTHDDIPLYLNDIEECQKLYQGKIKIYKGFESEFLRKGLDFYQELRKSVDYLLLGVHYFDYENEILSTYDSNLISYKTLKYYADACINGMETGLFKVLAHPDLFMMFYHNINNERKFDDEAIKQSKRIIESAIKNNVYLELNCNGPKRDIIEPCENWRYPYYGFWEIVKTYPEAKIIYGADAHNPDFLQGSNIKQVKEFAKNLGLKVLDKIDFND